MKRLCKCGCGKAIKGNKGKRFFNSSCRVRDFHARKINKAKASAVEKVKREPYPGWKPEWIKAHKFLKKLSPDQLERLMNEIRK